MPGGSIDSAELRDRKRQGGFWREQLTAGYGSKQGYSSRNRCRSASSSVRRHSQRVQKLPSREVCRPLHTSTGTGQGNGW